MLQGHGGDIYSLADELGVAPDELLDFSSNISPLPLPGAFMEFLSASLDWISMLPEVDSISLRRALAGRFGLVPENFIACAGTTEWIYRIARVAGMNRVVIPLPTYADYMDAALLAGRQVVESGPWTGGGPETAGPFLEDLSAKADDSCLVYLCNPNNPTGRFIPPDRLARAIRRSPDALWLIDESYAPFIADDRESSLVSGEMPSNCLVIRSFSKIYRIPGLRLGYLAGKKKVISLLSPHLLPWATGRIAQLAGEYLLGMKEYEEDVRIFCRREKRLFLEAVRHVTWLEYMPGQTHFMLFRIRHPMSAGRLEALLRQKGILVRHCGNFRGLGDDYIRISLKTHEENMRLAGLLHSFCP